MSIVQLGEPDTLQINHLLEQPECCKLFHAVEVHVHIVESRLPHQSRNVDTCCLVIRNLKIFHDLVDEGKCPPIPGSYVDGVQVIEYSQRALQEGKGLYYEALSGTTDQVSAVNCSCPDSLRASGSR